VATYPSGVFTVPTRVIGQTIQASWFNDPNAEVTAIEDALKNGITHPVTIAGAVTISTGGLTVSTGSVNISGPSSVATLQVNGNSTFAGNVVFTGTVTLPPTTFPNVVTLSSGAIVSTGIIRQDSLPMFNVWSSATTTRAGGSSAAGVNFTSQDYVRGTVEHSTGVASSQVHIGTTGVYRVCLHGLVSGPNDSPTATLTLWLNDATSLLQAVASPVPSTGPVGPLTLATHQDVRIASTGYLTLVAAAAGGAATLTFGSTSHLTGLRLMGSFLG
jgi:hypothetical protein